MSTVTLKKLKNFSTDLSLVNELYHLTKPSYNSNKAVLEREINRCEEIYLLYDNRAVLLAFFMISYETIEDLDTCYLGLSACHNDFKGFGYAKYLYTSFFADCKEKEKILNKKILCWWTTASPIPYKWFNENMNICEPDLSGNITENGKNILRQLVKIKYRNINVDETNPFILRGVAENTVYSNTENAKILDVKLKLKIEAFDKYPINEKNGDRYLMIGYV